MKKLTIIAIVLFSYSCFFSKNIQAQDMKELKKQVKKLKIEDLKNLKNQEQKLEEDFIQKQQEINNKKAQLDKTNKEEIKKRNEGIAYLEEQVRKIKKDRTEVNASKKDRNNTKCSFSVQIGAYKNKDLTQYMESNPNFAVESNEEGYKKYMLGFFTSYWEAKSFSKYLNNLGAQTYVAGFYDGKRVPELKDMTDCAF
jgi:DNA repair exonuclease SbcCD ATPase subunit